VENAVLSHLGGWESFYVIIGSSAAALTGLQFVVIALVAETRAVTSSDETINAFGTPTIVHFCAVLLMSAILSAPWHGLSNAGLALGACGFAGVVYVAIVVRRARRQTGYKPVFEDWLWHALLPLVGYAGLLVAATSLPRQPEPALFGIGTVALLLLFIGIHNAWDTVTYIAVEKMQKPKEADPSTPES
jgi:hypothetical protein